MRLRYLHICNYPPLKDVILCFNPPGLKDRKCAIRFVVGVNGSGKTHLLQAVAATFLALARQKRPHFPVALAWELGEGDNRRTLIFQNPIHKKDVFWWQSKEIIPDTADAEYWDILLSDLCTTKPLKSGWDPLIQGSNWPGKGVGLPVAVLAYTTGSLESWEWLFHREPSATDVNIVSQSEDYDTSIERPAGWNRKREIDYRASQVMNRNNYELEQLNINTEKHSSKEQEQETCMLLDPILLKFALLAVSLRQAMQDYGRYTTDKSIRAFMKQIRETSSNENGLRRFLSQVGWVWPVSVVIQVDFKLDTWGEREAVQKGDWLKQLYHLANEVVREPEPSTQRRLFFDLKSKFSRDTSQRNITSEYVGDALIEFLGGSESSPFDVFNRLLDLHRQGLLTDIQMAVRKADVDDILLFDELSDGEQVYLGRMALFHLLEGENDALLLLDEPEVHFNDKWKREIVDIIDDVLKDQMNDVLIATHSSITLTDVFNDEIILFEKREEGSVPIDIQSRTFGADPSEVMIRLFGVPDSIGNRALEWLDAQLDRDWQKSELDELKHLLDRVGPGFHRAELRGILKRLETNAPQD